MSMDRHFSPSTKWLTAREAAAHVRLCERSFRAAVKAGKYPPGKPSTEAGRRLLWLASDLDAALAGNDHAPSDPILAAIHAATPKHAEVRARRPR